MTYPSLSAQQIYDTAPLGSLIRFSDGPPSLRPATAASTPRGNPTTARDG